MIPQTDVSISRVVMPVLCLFFSVLFFGNHFFARPGVFLLGMASLIGLWVPLYFLLALPALYLRWRFPAVRQTWLRTGLTLGVHTGVIVLAIRGFFLVYEWGEFLGYTFVPVRMKATLLAGTAASILVHLVHEGFYTFGRWAQTLDETEKLKKINLEARLESLKQQVNPHFLFNSLNSLSSLIDEDPQRAEAFIEELSGVYRYLLLNNTDDLAPLSAELQFIRSYYHLLQTRYGSGITLCIEVPDACLDARLPPLTLQLLVENAVKHNVVEPARPLHIHIGTDEAGWLQVANNLQRKARHDRTALSNRVGLANIATKFALLGQPSPRIEETDGRFAVTLPLLAGP